MRFVSKKISYFSNIEEYDLCDIFARSKTNSGLTICYAIAVCKSLELSSLDFRAEHEDIGVFEKWHKKYSCESFTALFHNLNDFLDIYDIEDFGLWTLNAIYCDAEITVSGKRDKTTIVVSYSKEKKINLQSLLNEIELFTYEFNDYDKEIIEKIKAEFMLSEKRAVLSVRKLLTHKDIYNEFVSVIMSGEYAKEYSAISIEGYTAKMLNSNYHLSVLGAYNYLIYLRESPKEALEDLKKGLPRK